MKQLLKDLVANGFDAFQVTLQQIQCKDGSAVWAYSTYTQQVRANFFGNNAVNATCSVIDTSQPRVASVYSTKLVTVWLNCSDDTASVYRDECGSQAIAIVNPTDDGSFSVDLLTQDMASELLTKGVDTSPQPSQHI